MTSNMLNVLAMREEKCLKVTMKIRQWQSSVNEWIRQTVPRSSTNERTSSVGCQSTEAYSADHNWWSTLVGQEFVKPTHQNKSAILHSQQVSEESSNGRLITPRPPGYIEVWRERQVNVRHQTNDTKQSTSQQDCHVQQLHNRWNTVD